MYEKMLHAKEWGIEDAPLSSQWSAKTTYEEIGARAKENADWPAISFQLQSGPKDAAKTLNWQEFYAQVTKCANGFRKLGIGEKDVVAYLLPNCLEVVVVNQGAATAGIVTPINPIIAPDHIGGILHETRAKVLVTMAPFPKSEVRRWPLRRSNMRPMSRR